MLPLCEALMWADCSDNGVSCSPCQIVLEGYITTEKAPEGPFVDITGTRDWSGRSRSSG